MSIELVGLAQTSEGQRVALVNIRGVQFALGADEFEQLEAAHQKLRAKAGPLTVVDKVPLSEVVSRHLGAIARLVGLPPNHEQRLEEQIAELKDEVQQLHFRLGEEGKRVADAGWSLTP